MQLEAAVYPYFFTELVNGELISYLTDIRTNVKTSFKTLEHFLHVYSAAEKSFEGEDYGFMSNRGGEKYGPVIVAARYAPFLHPLLEMSKSSICAALTLLIVFMQPPWR